MFDFHIAEIDPDTGEVDNDVKFAHTAKKQAIVTRLRSKVHCHKCRTGFDNSKTMYFVSKDGERKTPSSRLTHMPGVEGARILRKSVICCASCVP